MANPVKELSQWLVKPAQIESELDRMWETLAKKNIQRASLFNLIVFHRLSYRTNYLRAIVQKVIDQFPCRTLFVSHDAASSQHYLKTAISVIAQEGNGGIACDSIDIGVAGSEWERVPFVILPHIIPDLPVYLLWGEDPIDPHPLFKPLAQLTTRVIFDSESTRNLQKFAKTLLALAKNHEIADLNWVRLEGWRELLASLFKVPEKLKTLKKSSKINLVYNSYKTESFCHLNIQSLYLLCWISSRLSIPIGKLHVDHLSWNKNGKATLKSTSYTDAHPGSILSLELETDRFSHIEVTRTKKMAHLATIKSSTKESCDLPTQFVIGKIPTGQSLSRELFFKGTSSFFLKTLQRVAKL